MAGRGPLPNPNARRTNKATVPTTSLPASGRCDPAPGLPHGAELGRAGMLWWVWAWSLPQSFGWSIGDHSALWRRASIEDDLAALRDVEGLSTMDLEGGDADAVRWLVRELASMVTGKLSLLREARELDGKFGLTPKGLADLRWTIVDDSADEAKPGGDSVVSLRAV